MQRRQYLSLSALVALAGCQGEAPADGQDASSSGADQNESSDGADQSGDDTDEEGNESGQQDLEDDDVEDPAENETDTENETEQQDTEEEDTSEDDDEPEPDPEAADRIETSIENITRAYDAYVRQGDGGLTGVTSATDFIRPPVRDRMSATQTHLDYAQREGIPRQQTTASELADIAEWLMAATDLQHYLCRTVEDFGDATDTLEGEDYEGMGGDFETVRERYGDVWDASDSVTTAPSDAGYDEIEGLTADAVESKIDQFNSEVSALGTVDDLSQDMRAVSRRVGEASGQSHTQAADTLDEAIRVLEDTEFVARDLSHDPINDLVDRYRSAARTCRRNLEDRRRDHLDQAENSG